MRRLALQNPDLLIREIESLREELHFCRLFMQECNSKVIPGEADTQDIAVKRIRSLIEENEALKGNLENRDMAFRLAYEAHHTKAKALEQILEFCGPAKMSETVGTLGVRLKRIQEIIHAALGCDAEKEATDN